MNIFITRPQKEDAEELRRLFVSVIEDAFKQDGIDESHNDDIREEVKKSTGSFRKIYK